MSRNPGNPLVEVEVVRRDAARPLFRPRPARPGPLPAPPPEPTAPLDALARALDAASVGLWLTGPGDRCETCALRAECADRARCLHRVAVRGEEAGFERLARVPFGARTLGEVARAGRAFVSNDGLDALGLADPAWITGARVRALAAAPLPGEAPRGVVAAFARRPVADAERPLLEAFAAALDAALGGGAGAAESALRPLDDVVRDAIEAVLRHTGGRVSGARGAAAILGLKPTTLESRMKKLGVRNPRRADAAGA